MLTLLLKSAMLDDDDIEKISHKMISLFRKMHSDGENTCSSSMRMIEAMMYDRLGSILMDKEDKNSEEIIRHLEKAHKLYMVLVGHDDAAEGVEMRMAKVLGDQDPMSELKHWKRLYEKHIEEDGEGSPGAFHTGKEFFKVLRKHEGVEAQRLLSRLIKQSRLTHGPEHSDTKDLEKWNECMVGAKYKYLDMEFGMHMFELVRYEASMEKCVLKGPVNPNTGERTDKEKILTFDADEIYLGLRQPVICYGSDYTDHEGKIGEVISWDKDRDVYTIKFEDKSLDQLEVKRTDTRVVLDLDA